MSVISRFRNILRPPLKRLGDSDEDAHFTLRLPARNAQDGDWLSFDCAVSTREDAYGEHVHLRTHLRADFSRFLPQSTPTPQADRLLSHDNMGAQSTTGKALAQITSRAGKLVDRALRIGPVQRALAPLADQRVESWMDIQGTTAPRDKDSREMLPDGLAKLGVVPAEDGPPIQSWAAPTPNGMAQITTMHLDERHLVQTKNTRDKTGNPLRLAATFAQVVETIPDRQRDEQE